MRNRIARSPKSRMNRAIPRASSSIVGIREPAGHAGGRGFESRRSRRLHLRIRGVAPAPVFESSGSGDRAEVEVEHRVQGCGLPPESAAERGALPAVDEQAREVRWVALVRQAWVGERGRTSIS